MAAVGGNNNIVRYTYTGAIGEVIPREATHINMDKGVRIVLEEAFRDFINVVELICHEGVEKIEEWAFWGCPRLRRVIMPGVKIVEAEAFANCIALEDVECGKLEIIREAAFIACNSLRSINLQSTRIVKNRAFGRCRALTDVKFGSKLQRFERCSFLQCPSLERIIIPLKDGLITHVNIFQECGNLKQVDLVDGELHETIAALHLEDWKNDMNQEIDSINQILPNASAGIYIDFDDDPVYGEKARAIRRWIRTVLGKIIDYQAEHRLILEEDIATTLELALPRDIAMNNVLPFLELPSHTFEVGDDDDVDNDDDMPEEREEEDDLDEEVDDDEDYSMLREEDGELEGY